MKSSLLAIGGLSLVVAGCQSSSAPVAEKPPAAPTPAVSPKVQGTTTPTLAPIVALVEPYLVPVAAPSVSAPPSLRGNLAPLPTVPIAPLPPAVGLPAMPPPTNSPAPTPTTPNPSKPVTPKTPVAPRRTTTLSPAIVKLFEDERAHSVDDARRRLTAATARATQATAEAKRQWSFVKSGFVAQKQAENADAAAKDALNEQSDAQKALDDAQQRQRNARRDIEAALKVAQEPSPFALAQLTTAPPTFQPVPGIYRLSVLGATPTKISVQNGILGRRLPPDGGEAGAWLVRCVDPVRLRVGVGTRPATVIVRTLPDTDAKPKA